MPRAVARIATRGPLFSSRQKRATASVRPPGEKDNRPTSRRTVFESRRIPRSHPFRGDSPEAGWLPERVRTASRRAWLARLAHSGLVVALGGEFLTIVGLDGVGVAGALGQGGPILPPSLPPPPPAPKVRRGLETLAPSLIRCARATVVVRAGSSQGSGTLIDWAPRGEGVPARERGDGIQRVLTASHVIQGAGASVMVELHRYNVGLETQRREEAGWPRRLPAEVERVDPGNDLAVLKCSANLDQGPARTRSTLRPKYLARVDLSVEGELAAGEVVSSLGIDRDARLLCWDTRVEGYMNLDVGRGGGVGRFALTSVPPEFGRSGGGLFLLDGRLVGVCVGRAKIRQGTEYGVFASRECVRKLLQ